MGPSIRLWVALGGIILSAAIDVADERTVGTEEFHCTCLKYSGHGIRQNPLGKEIQGFGFKSIATHESGCHTKSICRPRLYGWLDLSRFTATAPR